MPQSYINMTAIGTGGINTDSPPWAVSSTQAQQMRDVVIHKGLATQRRGWANYLSSLPYTTTTPAVPLLPTAVGTYFVGANGLMSTVAAVDEGGKYAVYSQNQVDTTWKSVLFATAVIEPQYVPRAQYQDEILLCDQNGIYPMLRFMGKSDGSLSGLSVSIPANSGVLTLATTGGSGAASGQGIIPVPSWSSLDLQVGAFVHPIVNREVPSFRVTKQTSDSFTVRDVKFTTAASAAAATSTLQMWGTTWPTVSVADDGLVSWATGSSTIDGNGTTFTGGSWGSVFIGSELLIPMSDSIRAALATKFVQYAPSAVTSATAMTVRGTLPDLLGEKVPYEIMRRSPFRDVEVHAECLWGTGVKQHPTRVYYSTRGWDMQTPPRLTPPWNGSNDFFEPNAGMLDYVEVGGAGSGDRVMALLSSDGPLLMLTERSCYGAYGKWPSFEKQMIAPGAGCIDTRSAVGVASYGQFWAGDLGIYGYRRGKVTELTSGRINDYWRRLMRKYDSATGSYVVCGVAKNHLIVSVKVTSGDDETVTLGCNLGTGAWTEFSNMPATGMHTPSVWDDDEKLLAALSGSPQLVDIAPAINMEGTARDADGTSPKLLITTGSGNASQGDPDPETRLVELRIGGVINDASDEPASFDLSVTSLGGSRQAKTESTITGILEGQDNPDIRRERVRIGNSGRTHEITIETSSTPAGNTLIALAEIGMNTRKRRAAR
jgi:hypothetical protein